jgi:hypothetical protein
MMPIGPSAMQRSIRAKYWQSFKAIWVNANHALQGATGISKDLECGVSIRPIFWQNQQNQSDAYLQDKIVHCKIESKLKYTIISVYCL